MEVGTCMAANTPGESPRPAPPASSGEPNGDAPREAEFLADLNGRDGAAPRPAPRRGGPAQIDFREVRQGALPGNKYIRVLRAQDQALRQVTPDHLVAGEQLSQPRGPFGKV